MKHKERGAREREEPEYQDKHAARWISSPALPREKFRLLQWGNKSHQKWNLHWPVMQKSTSGFTAPQS